MQILFRIQRNNFRFLVFLSNVFACMDFPKNYAMVSFYRLYQKSYALVAKFALKCHFFKMEKRLSKRSKKSPFVMLNPSTCFDKLSTSAQGRLSEESIIVRELDPLRCPSGQADRPLLTYLYNVLNFNKIQRICHSEWNPSERIYPGRRSGPDGYREKNLIVLRFFAAPALLRKQTGPPGQADRLRMTVCHHTNL